MNSVEEKFWEDLNPQPKTERNFDVTLHSRMKIYNI